MPHIDLATSEVIKRRLFRAREHLQLITDPVPAMSLALIAHASYEICSGLRIPAVKHEHVSSAALHLEDAILNLTTVIDFDLPSLSVEGDPEEITLSVFELAHSCRQISPGAPDQTSPPGS